MDWERFFIVGPTASGKSDVALELAQRFSGMIINCDSLQFFKDLRVGTAYPSDADMQKVPHRLFGICGLGEDFTAGEFVRRYHQFEDELLLNPKPQPLSPARPLLIVGGSGFYVRALETGMFPVAQDSMNADLPREHESWSKEKKIEFLMQHDPQYLQKVGPNDIYRIDRAIQLYLAEGKTMTQFHEQMQELKDENMDLDAPNFAFKLGVYVERDELLQRVQRRTQNMLKAGLIEEVQTLLHQHQVSLDWKPLQSVGYKETIEYLQGHEGVKTLAELEELIIKNTMNLAKRQMTWFRSDSEVVWFHSEKDTAKAMDWMEERLEQYLE